MAEETSTMMVHFDGLDDEGLREVIEHCVPHYPPTEEAKRRHESVRVNIRIVADRLVQLCPESPERDTAIWLLMNEVMFYANAAIARNHGSLESPPVANPYPHRYEPADINQGTSLSCCDEPPGATIHEVADDGRHNAIPIVQCRCPGGLCSHRK